jgi:hypothetical protein
VSVTLRTPANGQLAPDCVAPCALTEARKPFFDFYQIQVFISVEFMRGGDIAHGCHFSADQTKII